MKKKKITQPKPHKIKLLKYKQKKQQNSHLLTKRLINIFFFIIMKWIEFNNNKKIGTQVWRL